MLAFLVLPMLVIIPLAFNAEPYFTSTQGMQAFDPATLAPIGCKDCETRASLAVALAMRH
ncbi:MAG: hypothetical protein V7629_06025 [Motiliproteus sp.]